jgi:predicted dehydrogenase/threonine dehydrogenase-like Zn-dependent dehydrogenase
MKQVVQDIHHGRTEVKLLPDPIAGPHEVLVQNSHSLISQGTERNIVSLSRKSLLGKARSRPDHVRRVLQKVKAEGLASTAQQVFAKLNEPMALGYSTAGVVRGTGAGVESLKPGERVVTAGPHASVVAVGELLCARIPDGVEASQACFAGVGAIALQGIRLANVELGSRVLVIGLGLVGQLTVAMLKAAGCRVFGTDLDAEKVAMAKRMGADEAEVGTPAAQIMAFSGGDGVDSTLVTAATEDSGPMVFAAECTRLRGHVICVGLVGLDLPRPPFFEKELRFSVSGSFGPGRGSRHYEELGHDYPRGIERWTAQRNMVAFLDALDGGMDISPLISKIVSVEEVEEQYNAIAAGTASGFGYVIRYEGADTESTFSKLSFRDAPRVDGTGIGVVGCGNFSRLVVLPILRKLVLAPLHLRGICSAHGLNAAHSGEREGFDYAVSDDQELIDDTECHALFITTRHYLHAKQTCKALAAGKHVYVEKPLALNGEELAAVDEQLRKNVHPNILMVGFNRRFTRGSQKLRAVFSSLAPLTIQYRFAAGPLPDDSWLYDLDVGGGRVISEACHPIDWCIFMAQSPVVRVQTESIAAQGRTPHIEGRVSITLRHANGSLSAILYESGGSRAMPTERIEVFGGGCSASLEDWQDLRLYQGSSVKKEKLRSGLGHSESIGSFLRAVQDPPTDAEEWPIPLSQILNGAWATLAAVQSLREARPIEA